MKIVLIIFFATIALVAESQNEESILIGKKITIYSSILKENRKIWIYNPDLTSTGSKANKHYPVVYVLDGMMGPPGISWKPSLIRGNLLFQKMSYKNIQVCRSLKPIKLKLN